MGLVISLSALMYGYSMKEITSVPIEEIAKHYNFSMNHMILQGLLIGIMPFGAIFGSIVAFFLNTRVKRITGLHLSTAIIIIAIGIVQITSPIALFLGRFM